ncbi:MAG: cache domain-containing protein, partial [Candidatus Omnitrophica bacterium]|nr:cache domain-containing protein [Candidatus Omnitrophota bacterium]
MSLDKPAGTIGGKRGATSKARMVLWFCAIAAVILAAGSAYYRSESLRIQKDKSEELEAIGKMKIEQLLRWREERTIDITRLAESPAVRHLLDGWLRRTDYPGSREVLRERLRFEIEHGFYFQALFGDADKHILLSFPEAVEMETDSWSAVEKARGSSEPVLSDLHDTASGRIHMDIAMALRNGSDRPLTVAILTTDVREFLFPMLGVWPTSSHTAEAFLVRREGDKVLYLSNTRRCKDAALSLRLPLTQITSPAVQAVLGRTGAFLGRDCRGVNVLSDLRPVPETSWYLVSQVDMAEILT